jgi:hypothetical protein
MKQALVQFRINMDRVRHLSSIFHAFENITTEAIDLSDVLRAELVLAVSVLDHFIHDLVYFGMIEIYTGRRAFTTAYYKFPIPLRAAHHALSDAATTEWLETVIRQTHGWKSFQNPKNIAEAIRLISDINLWDEVGKAMNLSATDIKTELKTIVDRRNKIAHEADIDPTCPGVRWPITQDDVDRAVDFIHSLGEIIYQVIQSPLIKPSK